MKKLKYTIILLIFILIHITTLAQSEETIYIDGTKFTFPLIEKWISEYSKIKPGINIQLVKKGGIKTNSDLKVIAHNPDKDENADGKNLLLVGRYALLPVANNHNPYLSQIRKKGLGKKDLEKLFFEESILSDQNNSKEKIKLTVYARENQACTSIAFAQYFGYQSSEIKGKKVLGDDIYLLSSVKKDTTGITFNNPGYIYDNQTRKIKDGFTILPLDLKGEPIEKLNSNIDDIIALLEKNSYENIPVATFGFLYNHNNLKPEVKEFLKWIVKEGGKFNHDYGFLNLDQQSIAAQSSQLEEYLTSK